jgi:GNAT superfamily N-acetyltransferase
MDDRVGGFGWLSTGPEWIGEIGLEIRPLHGEGYIWNCFTIPEHRRKGIFRSILVGISNVALDEGLRRLWIGSVAIPAEKALGPSGFRPALSWSGFAVAGILFASVVGRDVELAHEAAEVLGGGPGIHLWRMQPRHH